MTPKLIAIEGIDGSGKSSLVQYLAEELTRTSNPVITVCTREIPREELFESVVKGYDLDPKSPAYMFFFQMLHADKAYRAQKGIESGNFVIADRWDLSFFVYHQNFGFFKTEPKSCHESVSALAFGCVVPDVKIYLDVSVDVAIDRRKWRGEVITDMDHEKTFYGQVTDAYRDLAKEKNWHLINADVTFDEVRESAWSLITA